MKLKEHYCMVGRYHKENKSNYKFAKLALPEDAKEAGFTDIWLEFDSDDSSVEYIKQVTQEQESIVECHREPAYVFTERFHKGNCQGDTYYKQFKVKAAKGTQECEAKLCNKEKRRVSDSAGEWLDVTGKVISGIKKSGDDVTVYFSEIIIQDGGKDYVVKLENSVEVGMQDDEGSYFYYDETVTENKDSEDAESYSYAYADWMSSIPSETELCNLILPASHDAGMSRADRLDCVTSWWPRGADAVKTQDLTIGGQLLHGSRYFDIRVDFVSGELVTYHRTGPLGGDGQTIREVFDQAIAFLSEHPTEAIIIKISHLRGFMKGSREKVMHKFLSFLYYYQDDTRDYWFKSAEDVDLHTLKLRDIRKKILLVFDFGNITVRVNTNAGHFRFIDVGTADSPKGNNALRVYDVYSNSSDFSYMKEDQITKWKTKGRNPQDMIFLLSWTITQHFGGSIRVGANEANFHLMEGLVEIARKKAEDDRSEVWKIGYQLPRLVYLDFIHGKLCGMVIDCNRADHT